ncbi:MAG: DUF4384 domain-containing protein [Desulfovibrio sp.]|jgi:hypothetical protein|nr:DUF4384 domain-containing protein [Desulfovibrio sp.]
MNRLHFTGPLLILVMLALAAPAFAARKTRDLVFEEEEETAAEEVAKDAKIENPQVIAVQTTLDLTRSGETMSVTPSHEFQSGDKVKLRYTTNADGYVYWLAKMSSGKYAVLFPTPQTGMDNFIKKNEEHTVPVKGAFRFDDTPGTESLLMIFSDGKVPELEQAVAEAAGQKTNTVDRQATQVASVEQKNTSKRKTRDLVFEEEEDEDVVTKSQVAPKGEPFVAAYELTHK